MELEAILTLPLALLVHFVSAAGIGLSSAGGRALRWWAGSLIIASAAITAACTILVAAYAGLPAPAECAALSSTGAAWVGGGLTASLTGLAALSVQAARLGARTEGAGAALAAVMVAEALAGLAVVFFLGWLAGGTSC